MSGWMQAVWMGAAAGAALAAVSGGLLIAFACSGTRRWARIGAEDAPTGPCDKCGYDLAGLEDGYCPECGWWYLENRRVPILRRVRAGAVGVLLVVLAVGLGLARFAAGNGIVSILPMSAAIAWLPAATVDTGPGGGRPESSVFAAVQSAVDAHTLGPWQRRLLASRCAAILAAGHDEAERLAAARLLVGVAEDAGGRVPAVLTAADDPSGAVRRTIADALAKLAQSGAAGSLQGQVVQRLIIAAACDRDELVRRQAVEGLARLKVDSPGAAGVLARALRDPSPRVRCRTLYALYARPGAVHPVSEREIAQVAGARYDEQADVREAAVFAMSRIAERVDGAVLLLGLSLRDRAPEVRQSAATCLARLGPRASPAREMLVASLEDADEGVQAAAAAALRAIGERSES